MEQLPKRLNLPSPETNFDKGLSEELLRYTLKLWDIVGKGTTLIRMTTTERNLISSPPQGLAIYNTTTSAVNIYTGSSWIVLSGTSHEHSGALNLRPTLVQTTTKASGTPTQVSKGLNVGYSLPVWNSGVQVNEELYFRMRIPGRWDETTDPQLGTCVTLSAGEDVGDKFKLQMEWQTTNKGNVMGATTSSTVSEQTVLTGRNDAYDTYFVFFNFNTADVNNPLLNGEMLQVRIRRIAASSSEVSNEIMLWDWSVIWPVNKVFVDWIVETNDSA